MKHGVKNRCFTHVVNSVSERIYASMMQIVLTFACFKAHSIRYKYAWRHRAELHSMHSDFCLIVYALNTLTRTHIVLSRTHAYCSSWSMMSFPPNGGAKKRHQSSPEYQFVSTVVLIVSLCGQMPVIFLYITLRSGGQTQHVDI